ncbi:hypothetical protein P170DRAFT_432204 [Aspergillus steynii IBT 23096]|uniref:Uncharacterized protein n=1 Tax=Aspergillus steynii IBT 23096 TaxID=1392250 RepID=A0A2I2GNX1_9EURO|nr:uncharacterized protein P170DRAFT_432204 [Aspergillus steynii IBT 23096]PLB54571.1 hypothetical protein P170DRAFT_432204 [Aspergillus steynii IBT 23096]
MRLQALLPALVAAATAVVAQDSGKVALVMADNACWAEFTDLLGCNGRSSEPIGDWDGMHCTGMLRELTPRLPPYPALSSHPLHAKATQ